MTLFFNTPLIPYCLSDTELFSQALVQALDKRTLERGRVRHSTARHMSSPSRRPAEPSGSASRCRGRSHGPSTGRPERRAVHGFERGLFTLTPRRGKRVKIYLSAFFLVYIQYRVYVLSTRHFPRSEFLRCFALVRTGTSNYSDAMLSHSHRDRSQIYAIDVYRRPRPQVMPSIL